MVDAEKDQGCTASSRNARVSLALGHEVRYLRPQHKYAEYRRRRRMLRDVSILLEVRRGTRTWQKAVRKALLRTRDILPADKDQPRIGEGCSKYEVWHLPRVRACASRRWTGQYFVADIDDFVGKDLHVDADPREYSFSPHLTRVVHNGRQATAFPYKDVYTLQNTTPDGIERHRVRMTHWKGKVTLRDDTELDEQRCVPDERSIDEIVEDDDGDDVEVPLVEHQSDLIVELKDKGWIGLREK